MKIQVLCFAGLKEVVGQSVLELTVPDICHVSELRQHLLNHFPELQQRSLKLIIAINGSYAADTQLVTDRDELACFPPVSGG